MTNKEVFNNIKEYEAKHPENSYFSDDNYVSLAGVLDYYKINLILNNCLFEELGGYDNFVIDNDDRDLEDLEIFQYYIVSNNDYEFLLEHFPNLFVYLRNDNADLCLLGVEHLGTSWRGVNVGANEFKGFNI